jgi:hypothetical protein
MMKQSGLVFAEENVPERPAVKAKTLDDIKRYNERPPIPSKVMSVSKKQWLSLPSNKQAYDDHIAKNQQIAPGALEPLPRHLEWAGKTAPVCTGKMSKHQWAAQLK